MIYKWFNWICAHFRSPTISMMKSIDIILLFIGAVTAGIYGQNVVIDALWSWNLTIFCTPNMLIGDDSVHSEFHLKWYDIQSPDDPTQRSISSMIYSFCTESQSAQLTPADYDVDGISVVFGGQCDVCFYTLCPSENGSIYAISTVMVSGFEWWVVFECPRYVIIPFCSSYAYW